MTGHSAVQLYDEESVARCKCASAVNHNCRVYDSRGGEAQESRDCFFCEYVVVLIDTVWHSYPYSIVYSCILYALRVCVYGYSVPIRLNFDADDGTNDTHDTQIQMSELVIKFLGYIFEYGALSPDHSRIHSSVESWCELPRNILNLLQSWGIP